MSTRSILLLLPLLVAVPCGLPALEMGEKSIEDARRALEPFQMEFDAARAVMVGELEKMRATEEYKKLAEAKDYAKTRELSNEISKPFMEEWSSRLEKVAEPFRGSEAEIAVVMLARENRLGSDPMAEVRRMLETYPASAHIEPLLGNAPYMSRGMEKEEYRAMITQIIEKNPSEELKAHAFYARGRAVQFDRKATDEEKAAMKADFDMVLGMLPESHLLCLRINGPEFEKSRLQVGMEVPDIVGADIAGKDFKLSDYRGKVIMLDFWGDW